MATLPPFLRSPAQCAHPNSYINASFYHDRFKASVHALWWPSRVEHPRTVLVFIPGNPGLVDFYTPFLTAIHDASEGKIPILAHAHIGHTPGFTILHDPPKFGLTAQVVSAIEAVDAVERTFGETTQVVVAGHSIGSWIALQVLKARPDTVSSVLLLFPTIAHIANTPNGRVLSPLFRPPLPYIISCISILLWLMPLRILWLLNKDWPLARVRVLRALTHSPSSIYSCLTMAHDEIQLVRELDAPLMQEFRHRLHLFFAEQDGWVGPDQRELILRTFDADPGSVKVVHGRRDIPHAFCINHGAEVAAQCFEWLKSGDFL
ncbi:hypothetical protein SCP_0106980 [Sparassis crispa]|uniref:Alpha/beta-hydrolase n=1 Tax=Sparassis crispa TaxID=139825 RepID=A0A401G6L9_9APHY|nr:hypothetical protein SCP_0106980 [Sparassis crispa]GBE77816.1 hypothetical protein SCP_0106980 [Sparassis crispa]